jgi:hypothetical protein
MKIKRIKEIYKQLDKYNLPEGFKDLMVVLIIKRKKKI